MVCDLRDALVPAARRRRELIRHVTDRPGHDFRYAMDASKLKAELGWAPCNSFEGGMARTVEWYLANQNWWRAIREGTYQGERLGLSLV